MIVKFSIDKNNFHHGLIIGLLTSIVFTVLFTGPFEISFFTQNLTVGAWIAAIISIFAVGIGIASAIRINYCLRPAGDGIVYGFVMLFDMAHIINSLRVGELPLP